MEIPAVVRTKALAVGGEAWLDSLPDLVNELERDWSLSVGRTFSGGTEALVLEATVDDDTPAVLKLLYPDGGSARSEITTLQLAGGLGCVTLYRDDPERGALLMERLGRPLSEVGLPIEARQAVLCAAAARVWRPAPDCGLPTGAEKAAGLAAFITKQWEDLDRPCTEAAVDQALGCAARRRAAHDDERSVLVHGDVHQWNALEAGGDFKLIDPDGLLAEAEYDLSVPMREDPADLLEGDPVSRSWRRAEALARLTGLDVTAVWEWGVVERVSTGLLCVQVGLQPAGGEMLEVADRLAATAQAARS